MANLVMGYWDCPICGTREIRGDVTNCPSCGRARGEVQFYMKGYNEGETREDNEPWPDPNIPYDPEEIIADAEKHVKEKREAYENLHPGIYRL